MYSESFTFTFSWKSASSNYRYFGSIFSRFPTHFFISLT